MKKLKQQQNSRNSKLQKSWKTADFLWKYEKTAKIKKIKIFKKCGNEVNFEESIKISANFKTIQNFKKKLKS